MTTPNQSSPDGAITIGGGEWMYGQSVNEQTARSAFELPMPTPDNMLELLRTMLEMLDLDALKPFADFLGIVDGVFTNITEAVDAIIGSLIVKPAMQTVEAFTEWLTEFFGPLNTMFNQVVDILGGAVVTPINDSIAAIVEFFGELDLGGWLTWVTETFTPFYNMIMQIVTLLTGGLVGTPINEIVEDVMAFLAGIPAALTQAVKDLIHAITGVLDGSLEDVMTWVSNVGTLIFMGVGTIIEKLTGIVGGTLEDLTEWVTHLLTEFSKIPAWNLFGQIPAAVMGILNIGHLTTEPINLLLHPKFDTSSTVVNVDGWSWDGTQTATGSGGSAKVVCDGYNKELLHQTAVLVAPGDKMVVSAQVKTSGVTGSGWKAAVSVMEYRDGAIATPVEIAARTAAATSWEYIAGDYTVPPNVTSVVFRLTVENASSGTVWFDDLDFHKSGVLEQGWVENLPNTWENLWDGLVGTSGAGKQWSDMGAAGYSARNRAALAQGGADTANGNLQTTWNSFYNAHAGTSGATGQTPASAAAAAGGVRTTAVSASGTASTAYGTAAAASGNIQDTWNKMWEAVFGGSATGRTASDAKAALNATASTASGANSTASTANGAANTANFNLQDTWNKLFDAFNGTAGSTGRTATDAGSAGGGVRTTAATASSNASTATTNANSAITKVNGVNSTLFGTTAGGSQVRNAALPLTTILPTAGSGAMISRRNTTNVNGNVGRVVFPSSFFDYQDRAATNITTYLSQGMFVVQEAGWYMVELSFRLNPSITFGFSVAPLLFKGNVSSQVPYKIGNDAIMGTWGFGAVGNRYAQSTWIVYLAANEAVRAGFDAGGTGADIFDADASGIETYFSISMMNKIFG